MASQYPSVEQRLKIRESWRPDEFGGYINGLRHLYCTVLNHPPRIVELGTYVGNSTFAWLSEWGPNEKVNGEEIHVWTVDLDHRNVDQLVNDLDAYGWKDRVSFLVGDSIALGEKWDKGKVDMVYVDTSHEYVQTRREIETWLPHIKQGGWLVLDDYTGYPEVAKAYQYATEVSCKGKFTEAHVYYGPPYTPKTHGLLAAKIA